MEKTKDDAKAGGLSPKEVQAWFRRRHYDDAKELQDHFETKLGRRFTLLEWTRHWYGAGDPDAETEMARYRKV